MHIVELAVSDPRLAAASRSVPLTDGLAAAMISTLKNGSRIFALALLDLLSSLFGRQPIYILGHINIVEFNSLENATKERFSFRDFVRTLPRYAS